jgi:hypothetical protein
LQEGHSEGDLQRGLVANLKKRHEFYELAHASAVPTMKERKPRKTKNENMKKTI